MKNIPFITILLLIASLKLSAKTKPLVVSTTNFINDITKNIGGEAFDYQSLVPTGGDPHSYEPIPQDVILVNKANLILKNGLNLEGWISELINNSGTKATTVTVSDGVKAIESIEYKNSFDPHAWMNPINGIIYAENIAKSLIIVSPKDKDYITERLLQYSQELKKIDLYIKEKIKEIPEGQRILITNHDAFRYYGMAYNLQLESMLGISTEAEVQTSDIIRVIKTIKEYKVPTIFIETTINPKQMQQIASDAGIQLGDALYADSLGPEGSDGENYLKMLQSNTDKIVKGLSIKYDESKVSKKNNSSKLLFYIIGIFILIGLVFFIRKMITKNE